LDAATLPFRDLELPPSPRTILIEGIERAFPDFQIGSTRLVLTQSTYLMQKCIDAVAAGDRIVATADRDALERGAPEALQGRGPWRYFEVALLAESELEDWGPGDDGCSQARQRAASPQSPVPQSPAPSPLAELLAAAYATRDPAERLRLCRQATERAPD